MLQDEKIERSISFVHNGKTVVFDLVPNRCDFFICHYRAASVATSYPGFSFEYESAHVTKINQSNRFRQNIYNVK